MERLRDVEHHHNEGEKEINSGDININSLEYKLMLHDKVNEIVAFINTFEGVKADEGDAKEQEEV